MTDATNSPNDTVARPAFLAVLLFFFVSGGCGLLYQVVWTRKLVLLFGTTSYAVSTVLSVFFLGLALGSIWGGRLADGSNRPLKLYGIMEIVIGLWALAFILLIGVGESMAVGLIKTFGSSRAMGVGVRALLAGGLLLVPVTLMGATLPLLARFVTARGPVLGSRIGTLYSLNTMGAVAGCATTGFVLLAGLGYTRTTLVGAVLNVAIGVLAIAMDRRGQSLSASDDADDDAADVTEARSGAPAWTANVVVIAFAISGFCSLALEVLWTRLLAIVFLGTTYAFATMLTTVLCGIALGSAVASAFADRLKDRATAFGFVQVLTAAACVGMLALFPLLPDLLQTAQADASYEWNKLVGMKFFLSFMVLFTPTFLFGMSFPLALKAYADRTSRLGHDVGRLYAANTLGGVLGAIAGGFFIIPALGAHDGIVALAFVLAAGGLLLLVVASGTAVARRGALGLGGAAALGAAVFAAPADVSYELNHWFIPEDHEILHYSEGVEGTVVVSGPVDEPAGTNRVLWINAVQATASIEKGVKMNRFQGVLPLLFDREIDEALFMCFGSGVTAGTLALSPFERIDAVELSRDVLGAAPLFGVDNFDVLENPRINAIVDDGRNFLLTTENEYDLITFEPMPLALAGVSTFYTQEYYELCRARLAPGGIVSQWIPLHNGLSVDVIKGLFNTFVDAFPETVAWFINADMFLIGSEEPLRIDYDLVERRLAENPRLREGLGAVYLPDVPELMASFFMGREQLEKFVEGADIMTDDRPWAEFLAPKMIYEGNVQEMLEVLQPYREPVTALLAEDTSAAVQEKILRRHRAHLQDMEGLKVYYSGVPFSDPQNDFRKSLEIDPADANAKYYLAQILINQGALMVRWDEYDKAVAMLTEAEGYAPHRRDLYLALGDAYHEAGDPEKAAESYGRYLELGGQESRATERARP